MGGAWFLNDHLYEIPVSLHALSIFEVLIPDIWDLRVFIIALAHHDQSLIDCNFCHHAPSLGIF